MPVIEFNKIHNEQEEKERRQIEQVLNEKIRIVIQNELTQLQSINDTLTNLYQNGYLISGNTAMMAAVTTMNCAAVMYRDLFTKGSEQFNSPDSREYRKQISKRIAEERYPELLEKINQLSK
jgi:NADPH:quinone reductase-like Zn-dependent oxidoreductase